MCKLCDQGRPQDHSDSLGDSPSYSRRNFLKAGAAGTAAAAAGLSLFTERIAVAQDHDDSPRDSGRYGRRYVIRGGHVMSMDPNVGDFVQADVLVEGKKILAVGPNLPALGAVIDARGKIVMPGFVDTHHHQFETALRSFLADGLLFNDGKPHGAINYFEFILGKFAPVYRPQDVYINELFGALSQIDAGVTTVHDISQIHHSPQHSDAAIKGLADSGRRSVLGYFESAGNVSGNQYPADAARIKAQYFTSDDQLLSMTMGGEIYLPGFAVAWTLGRQLGLQVVAHIVGSFGMGPTFDALAASNQFGPDNLFIHMTGMSDMSWQKVKDAGASVSLAVPIEMNMRHGMPPILKTLSLDIQPSLSVDVECTLTADMFTQMRSAMALQKAFINQMALEQNNPPTLPELLTTRDVLRFATMEGARDLRLDRKTGSLTPGKEADIIILDAEAINVAPLNVVPGAVVSLMERSNVETVIVAGKVRKWKGKLLDVDLRRLRRDLEASRDYLFNAAGIPQNLFRLN
ncbi:MAG: twin-arginine translocation signal domain-containing protein [Variovorax sp.]|nr:MAG: twin-arginine translocation signal domain-containing protein [Variovorax sp.]